MSTNKRGRKTVRAALARRLTSLALAAVMLWGLLPGLTPAAEAAEWMEPYLEQLVEWGVMQGSSSGNLNPDRVLTRAEFVTMINRAFGYTERGTTPFQDVPENAWYADDINIAYQAGYFTGTSETTASPGGRVTREQAAVLLGRNLRLQGIAGVNSNFTDVYQMGNWSRGMVQECVELGIIQGYADGTFRPKNYITRGQMACFLVRALGTLVHETGDQIVGGVYGNLTVNTSGVKLKDTVVTGNLYLSGGVGLGNVELENVTVMGKIVVCGAGEAERGQSSIILRNVTAEAMEIDSLSDNFMTVRTEGLTNIANTTVRTSAYLEDVTDDDQGLRLITLDGTSDGTRLQLAGNIKEVVNITPNSNLQVVQGITDKLTVDERAVGSALSIANDTTVRILNLDAGVPVTGNGDVSKMNVNAAGATATMLPDNIFIRPGIESNIHNQVMDNKAAEESSDEPRLLSGYPLIRNLASTSADGVFSTNKRGTLYWAVSALLDGSVGEDELRNPSAYPGKVLRSGTINVTASKTEMTARLTGLSREGSYYLAAMLVDERGHASPVKVTAFTTTDDSAPSFAAGYPEAVLYVTDDDEQIVQARVMATKTCRLYYALMPQSAAAPTANDLRSGAVAGNLGYGSMEVRKNTAYTISKVNSAYLQEKTTYALYLWLNDSDNGKSSAVQRLLVTTKDVTPPVIERLEQTEPMTGTTVTMTYSLNEPGTLYWAIVKKGTPFFDRDIEEVGTPPSQANNELAKMQIKRGLGVKRGSSNAARESTDVNFTITGLEPQTAYDLYYVAEDRDGNFNIYTTTLTPPMQVNTLDEMGPTVTQEFTHDGSDGDTQHPTPYADTSIRLVFSEEAQGIDSSSKQEPSRFLRLYESGETALLAQALEKHVRLFYTPAQGGGVGQPILLTAEDKEYGSIDYSKAEVKMDNDSGEMIITFPQDKGGLKLASGAKYYFELEGIYDTVEPRPNPMAGTKRGILTLPEFTTLFATVNLELLGSQNVTVEGQPVTADQTFRLTPVGTESVSENTLWDMLVWTDSTISYTLYCRERARTEDGVWGAWSDWGLAGTAANSTVNADVGGVETGRVYASLNGYIKNEDGLTGQELPPLKELVNQFEYAITITDNTHIDPNARNINMEIMVLAGGRNSIQIAAGRRDLGQDRDLKEARDAGAELIHVPNPFKVPIPIRGKVPVFENGRPYISPGDTAATVTLQLDLPSKVYYLAVPITNPDEMTQMEITTANGETRPVLWGTNALAAITPKKAGADGGSEDVDLRNVYVDGSRPPEELTVPTRVDITTKRNYGVGASQGNSAEELGGPIPAHVSQPITIPNLIPETYYLLYLVTENYNTNDRSVNVVCYQFYTKTAELPIIQVSRSGSRATEISVGIKKSALLEYNLIPTSVLTRPTSPFAEAFSQNAVNSYTGISNVTSVLDAMLTDYNGRGSVFDNFATPEAKLRFGTLIRSLQGSGQDAPIQVSPSGGERYENDGSANWVSKSIDLSRYLNDPSNQNYYTLLVVGHSLNSDVSNDAFRASQPYFYENKDKLIASGYATADDSTKAYFTGTIQLNFSDNLSFRVRDPAIGKDVTYILDSCERVDSNHVGDDQASGEYKSIGSIMRTSVTQGTGATGLPELNMDRTTGHGKRIGNTLFFEAKNLKEGSYIFFESGLCGSNREVREGTSLTATLRRRTVTQATDKEPAEYEWYIQFTPDTWLTR